MASQVLMSISRSEEERMRLLSDEKYEMDRQSELAYEAKKIARKMKVRGRPFNEISEDTGLDIDTIMSL